jgi:hypothetical protein
MTKNDSLHVINTAKTRYKIHAFWDGNGHTYTPCGQSIRYSNCVPVEHYHLVPEERRCKFCNGDNFYQLYQKTFPKVGDIRKTVHNLGHAINQETGELERIVIQLWYIVKNVSFQRIRRHSYRENNYQRIRIESIKFSNNLARIDKEIDLSYFKNYHKRSEQNIYHHPSKYPELTEEKKEYVEKFYKFMNI